MARHGVRTQGDEGDDLKDDLGSDVPLSDQPRRVVSLVPSLTEAVAQTVPEALIGATDYCTHPAALDVVRVGGTKYPKVESVRSIQPDLVLANSEENRPGDVEQLRAAGIPVWVMAAPATVPMALTSLRSLFTEIFAMRAPSWLGEAEHLWQGAHPIRLRALVPVWRKPWVVLGRDTFGGDVLHRLGVSHVYRDHEERYPRPKIAELRARFQDGEADLLVLPDEPYAFADHDGPEAFGDVAYVLISGRYLTWYGPSLVSAYHELMRVLPASAR